MSRPEYPNCVMTSEIIHSIRREQEYYDQDPDRYERRQQEQREYNQMIEDEINRCRLADEREQEDLRHEQWMEDVRNGISV